MISVIYKDAAPQTVVHFAPETLVVAAPVGSGDNCLAGDLILSMTDCNIS